VPAENDSTPPLTRATIVEVIQRNLGEIMEKSPADIGEDQTFEALGADSLALIELVEALEDELSTYASDFHIDDEDLEDLVSVRDAVNYVAAKLQVA
jgi:acyl carrier protein